MRYPRLGRGVTACVTLLVAIWLGQTVLSIADYREQVLSLAPAPVGERVTLSEARGRVLAADIRAVMDIPHWDNSAMDGFAVNAASTQDAPVRLSITGEIGAGDAAAAPLEPTMATGIMTGAPVPLGADAVIPVEDAHVVDGQLVVRQPIAVGRHVRRRGEDVRADDVVVRAGRLLDAVDLAAAVAAGHAEAEVYRRPRVAVIATGAELVPPGTRLGPGQIYDSNSVLLAGLIVEAGGEVLMTARCGDDSRGFVTVLEAALEADLVVTSGGVSMGTRDVVKEVLAGPGMEFTTVAMQPGKPQACGVVDGTPIVCLPGNPVSVFVSFHVFVAPLMRRMAGRNVDVPTLTGVVAQGWSPRPGRTQVMPVCWSARHAGRIEGVRPAHEGGSASHHVSSLARAHGLAVVPEDVVSVVPGDILTIMEVRP